MSLENESRYKERMEKSQRVSTIFIEVTKKFVNLEYLKLEISEEALELVNKLQDYKYTYDRDVEESEGDFIPTDEWMANFEKTAQQAEAAMNAIRPWIN